MPKRRWMQLAKSNFIVRGGANFNPLYQEFNKAQKRMTAFQAGVKGVMKGLGVALGSLAVGKLVKDSVGAAMGVESAMNQISRIMGSSADTFENWAQTQAKSFGMAREEAFKYGAVYSNLISTFAKDTKETTQLTTDLIKASAVVASSTGRTMEDTMDRIRSGLLGNTEAIEDLGINVNVAMLQSTKAFQQFAKGKSWQQLTFQEQQQIRLMAILEQANTKYGGSLAGTTATRQMMFLATLKNIRLNIGQAFLPIYNVVLPALTSLAAKLEYVTSIFAAFSQSLFGKAAKVQTKDTQAQAAAVGELGDATAKAGKQAKGALAGFDELNVLQKDEGGGGVGGTTEAGVATVNEEDVSATKLEEMEGKITSIMTKLRTSVQSNKDLILSALAGLAAGFAAFKIVGFISGLGGVKGALTTVGVSIGKLSTAFMTFITSPAALIAIAIGAIVAAFVYLYRTNDDVRASFDIAWAKIKEIVVTSAALLKQVWDDILWPVFQLLIGFIKDLWEKHLSDLLVNLGTFVASLIGVAADILNKFILPIISYFVKKLGPEIKGVVNDVLMIFGSLITFLVGVFTGDWEKAWKGVKEIFTGVWNGIVAVVESAINIMADGINWLVRQLNKIKFEIPSWVPGVGGKSWGINISEVAQVKLPRLTEGGITQGMTTAVIGEAGKEAVLPLENNTEWMDTLADRISDGLSFNVNFSGSLAQLARVLNPEITRDNRRIGRNLVGGAL